MSTDPNFPHRPDHPDFKTMSEAVKLVDDSSVSGKTVREILDLARIDTESLMYMAQQRGLRIYHNAPAPESTDEKVANLAAGWIDGFLAGLRLGEERTQIENAQLLDGSLDNGNRRQGKS